MVLARTDDLKIGPKAKGTVCHASREGWTAVARWTAPLQPEDQIPGDVRVQTGKYLDEVTHIIKEVTAEVLDGFLRSGGQRK
jgi:hypothetical protein